MSTAPFGRRSAQVVERRAIGPYVVLSVADPAGPEPAAGQFYMLAAGERWGAGDRDRPYLPRACSVMRARDGVLEFLLEDVGPGTHRLCELADGAELWLTGPLGVPFTIGGGPPPLLVGGGVGIAPLVILADMLSEAPALLGFRDAAHAEAAQLFTAARVATDDGSTGTHGYVTELLAEELAHGSRSVFACGPPAMLEAVRASCEAHGAPAQLALESPMACGFGACYGCVVATRDGYRRVCVDGPVFDAAALEAVA